jgi:hypothetical protein
METLCTPDGMPIGEVFRDDVSSGWSGIQTITVPGESQLSPPPETATFPPITSDGNGQPQTPDFIVFKPFFMLVVGALLGGVVVTVVMVVSRRHIKTSTHINDSLSQTSGVGLYA